MKFINSVFVLHPDRLFCMLTCTVSQTLQKKNNVLNNKININYIVTCKIEQTD